MTLPRFLLSACALLALSATPAQAGDILFDSYNVSGSRGGPRVIGYTRFATQTDQFTARFEPAPVGGSAVAPLGALSFLFDGTYEELDLFFISFWSAEGTASLRGTNPFTGSGIRLLFGLLTFGTLEELGGPPIAYSGVFDEVVSGAPRDEPSWVARAVNAGRAACDRAQALAPDPARLAAIHHQPTPETPHLRPISALPSIAVLDDPAGRLRAPPSRSTELSCTCDVSAARW